MEYLTYKKNYKISCEPEDVYAAITNPFTIELWSGSPAIMEEVENSEFSLWEGDIVGRNISFEKDKRVVQEWYFGDNEPKSIVTISIHKDKSKTRVYLVHENIPSVDYENIVEGWDNYYLGAIKTFLEDV